MRHRFIWLPVAILFLASCADVGAGGASGRSLVEGAGNELLKLRAGPGLGYRVILGLPDGTALRRHHCVTEMGQRWCRVSLVDAPGMTGFVSADYLSRS